MKRLSFVFSALLLCAAMPAAANPVVTIYADAGSGEQGETVEVSLSAENDAAGMSVWLKYRAHEADVSGLGAAEIDGFRYVSTGALVNF